MRKRQASALLLIFSYFSCSVREGERSEYIHTRPLPYPRSRLHYRLASESSNLGKDTQSQPRCSGVLKITLLQLHPLAAATLTSLRRRIASGASEFLRSPLPDSLPSSHARRTHFTYVSPLPEVHFRLSRRRCVSSQSPLLTSCTWPYGGFKRRLSPFFVLSLRHVPPLP